MHYFKLFALILILFFNINLCNAVTLDSKSVNYHNDSIYYIVIYYDDSVGKDIAALIQSKGNEVGIIDSCDYAIYYNDSNRKRLNPLTQKTAAKFFTISPTSKLYEANEKAMQIIKQSIPELNMQTNTPSNNVSENNFTKDGIDFKPYMKKLQRNIKRNWHPPKCNESKRVVLLFKIAKDGKLLSNRVYKTSGIPTVDQAALNAVEMTAPFKQLPAEFREESVEIQFTFDYNVFGAEN